MTEGPARHGVPMTPLSWKQRGIPTISVFTSAFASLANTAASTWGIEKFHLVTVPHPLESMGEEEIVRAVEAVVEAAGSGLIGDRGVSNDPLAQSGQQKKELERILHFQGSEEELYEWFLAQGWTDGLPVIPPTPERVEAMLSGTPGRPEEVLGLIPPRWAELTMEKLAANAVMAGCTPEHMPVLIAAIEGLCSPPSTSLGSRPPPIPQAQCWSSTDLWRIEWEYKRGWERWGLSGGPT